MILCHWSNRLECTALALEVPFISILRLSENIASPGPFLGFKRQVWAKRLHRDKSVQSVTMQLAVLLPPLSRTTSTRARGRSKLVSDGLFSRSFLRSDKFWLQNSAIP